MRGVRLAHCRAVAEVKHEDLAHLGLQIPIPPVLDGPEPSYSAAQAIPFNDRAMAVMKQISYESDDRELLLALLKDEGRRVERVLHHLAYRPRYGRRVRCVAPYLNSEQRGLKHRQREAVRNGRSNASPLVHCPFDFQGPLPWLRPSQPQ